MKIKFFLILLFLSNINFLSIAQEVDSTLQFPKLELQNKSKEFGFRELSSTIPGSIISNSEIDYVYDDIDYLTLSGVGAVYLGAGIGVHIYQRNAWWSKQRRSFHFVNDWEYALWVDKVGHFYGAALLSHAFSAGLEAGNVDLETSAILGSIGGFLFQMYVEIEDGFGPDWGFSPGDAGADLLGAAYSLGQYYIPELKNFQFKVSYYPSLKYREGRHKGNIIDDYEGQKYWLSIRVNNYLPASIEKYWPDFLCVALGYGVDNLNGRGGGGKNIYLSLDLDAESIPLYGKGWQFIKNTLNYLHFPMPGLRISPKATFFMFTF